MNLPKKIKIGGHDYQVVYPYEFRERTDLFGQTDHTVNEIRISEDNGNGGKRSESPIEETFWHEIIHCIDQIYNGRELKEETVLRLSQGLFQVLTDNFEIKPKEEAN